jgi:aspartate dehydrogenase
MRVGVIGFGAIGQQVVQGVADGLGGDAEVCAILVRRPRAGESARPVTTDFATFLASDPGVVLEAASPEAVVAYAEPVLAAGAMFLSVSTSALVDTALRARLEAAYRQSGARLIAVAGALAGVDALASAAIAGLDAVALRVVEPGEQPWVEFRGSAVDGAREFPSRLNVAATAMLAARTDVGVTLERGQSRAIELTARGTFGEFVACMQPRPRPDQLSHIVALSLLAAVRRLQQPLQVG